MVAYNRGTVLAVGKLGSRSGSALTVLDDATKTKITVYQDEILSERSWRRHVAEDSIGFYRNAQKAYERQMGSR